MSQLLVNCTDLSYHLKTRHFSADGKNLNKFSNINQLNPTKTFFPLNFLGEIKEQAKVISLQKFFIFPSPYSFA